MNDLEGLRNRIDEIDSKLLALLNERAAVALAIGELKEREGLPVYAPDREAHLIKNVLASNQGPLRARSLRAIFREIVSASRSLEKDLRIACAGSQAGLCHQAAISHFGSSVDFEFHHDIAGVFDSVQRGGTDCGIVPIETVDEGPCTQTMDCLAASNAAIWLEVRYPAESGDQETNRFFIVGTKDHSPVSAERTSPGSAS